MLKKILVALDHSSEASAVFDFALSLAQPATSEILLAHFVDWQMQDISPWIGLGTLYDVEISGSRYDSSHHRLQNEVEIRKDWLKSLTKKAQQLNITCNYECQVGNCNLGIGDRAKGWGADLIVIGRRGHRNISEMFLGSVSNYVIHHAPCSVLVVQGTKTGANQQSAVELVDVVNTM
ncbi:MAG: universal stress protein [Cyanobacteria bacterium P01_A01_bin.40]